MLEIVINYALGWNGLPQMKFKKDLEQGFIDEKIIEQQAFKNKRKSILTLFLQCRIQIFP
jgi:hypothetical protein